MRRIIFAALTWVAVMPQASADSIRRSRIVVEAMSETEGVGCYWKLGRRFCSLYCYWEVNGRRYCHVREREATPQGPPPDFYPDTHYSPMKLGVGN